MQDAYPQTELETLKMEILRLPVFSQNVQAKLRLKRVFNLSNLRDRNV